MFLWLLETNQSKHGKGSRKYEFSPHLDNVSWIFLVWSLYYHWWPWLQVSQFCRLKLSGFFSHHAFTLLMTTNDLLVGSANEHVSIWSPAAYGTVLTPSPLKCALLAFRIPASYTFVHFSSPRPQHSLLAPSLPLRADLHSLVFSLQYSEQFWESHVSVFTQSVLAPRFQVLSRTVLFHIVGASHTWLFKWKILK